MSLNQMVLKNVKPRKTRYELKDGDRGLYLRVHPSGAMAWCVKYKFEGRLRRLTLGEYPVIGLSDARLAYAETVAKVKAGVDPGRVKIEEKTRMKGEPTFKDFLNEYWETYLVTRKAGADTWRLIAHDALPAWKKRKLAGITRRDVVRLLDKVKKRAPVGANRLVGALNRMFNHAIRRGVLENNPCHMVERLPEKPRARVLDNEEIKALWLALDLENKKIDLFRSTKLALRLILLTGCRGGEVAGALWSEITPEAWTIPGERTKNGDVLVLPVTPMMQQVFDEALALSAGRPHVFASSHLKGPVTRHSFSVACKRHWREVKVKAHFTPHDIRRTVRTKLAEIGVSDVVAERVMGHRLQGILRVYNQYDYFEEKRAALLQWEAHLRRMVGLDAGENSNVLTVDFKRR
jgi:integrase